MSIVTVERKILEKNDDVAAQNRQLFRKNNLFTINLLSSPGSGKTSLLEKTMEDLNKTLKIGVVEGDVQTDNDAQRIAKYDVPVVQIVTNGGCHLEAKLVQNALDNFKLSELDLLVIENVGNLVCPANYDLGEEKKIVMVSTTEGDDKPSKYPAMFRVSDVMVINKIDLLPYVDFDLEKVREHALTINPDLTIMELSCKTGEGFENWVKWLQNNLE
jgi:hydrogenase nickel incorporation protein HypB